MAGVIASTESIDEVDVSALLQDMSPEEKKLSRDGIFTILQIRHLL